MQKFSSFFQSLGMAPPEKAVEPKKKAVKWKSGGFPYYVDPEGGQVYVCLFISNDPLYGGRAPQMPKGHPDPGEKPKTVAAREASEETGIPFAALNRASHLVTTQKFQGETSTYLQYVYGFPLDKPYKAKPNNEGKGLWFKLEDAQRFLRKDQRPFINLLAKNIK